MNVRGKKGLENFSKSWARVRFLVLFIGKNSYIFAEKRIAAQKAEADFLFMLKESGKVTENSVWKEVSPSV